MGSKEIKSPFVESPKVDQRFTDNEIALLQRFDERGLKLLRKVFYFEHLVEDEVKLLKGLVTEEVIDVLKKMFLLPPTWSAPLFQNLTRWDNPRYEQMLANEAKILVMARQKALRFLGNGIYRLRDLINDRVTDLMMEIDLNFERDYTEMPPELVKLEAVAVQDFMMFLESTLFAIYGYTQQGKETIEQIKEKMKRDSAK